MITCIIKVYYFRPVLISLIILDDTSSLICPLIIVTNYYSASQQSCAIIWATFWKLDNL